MRFVIFAAVSLAIPAPAFLAEGRAPRGGKPCGTGSGPRPAGNPLTGKAPENPTGRAPGKTAPAIGILKGLMPFKWRLGGNASKVCIFHKRGNRAQREGGKPRDGFSPPTFRKPRPAPKNGAGLGLSIQPAIGKKGGRTPLGGSPLKPSTGRFDSPLLRLLAGRP